MAVPHALSPKHQLVALLFYILCEMINKNQFVANFVVCIVLLAADFWVVSEKQQGVKKQQAGGGWGLGLGCTSRGISQQGVDR